MPRRRAFFIVSALLTAALPAWAQPEVKLAWKFKEGDKFYLSTLSTIKQSMAVRQLPGPLDKDFKFDKETLDKFVADKESKQDLEQSTLFSVTVQKVNPDGSAVLEQKVESVGIKALSSGATAPDEKIAQQLVGASFKVTLGPGGRVEKVENFDDLVKKIAEGDAAMQKIVQSVLSPENLKQSSGDVFSFLPDKPVKPGAKWELTTRTLLGALGGLATTKMYTYEGPQPLDGAQRDKITFTAATKYEAPEKADTAALNYQVVKGDLQTPVFSGSIYFDNDKGRLVQSEMVMELRGGIALAVGNTTLLTKVSQDIKLNTRLLDKPPAAK
jgi:hypothetical protein